MKYRRSQQDCGYDKEPKRNIGKYIIGNQCEIVQSICIVAKTKPPIWPVMMLSHGEKDDDLSQGVSELRSNIVRDIVMDGRLRRSSPGSLTRRTESKIDQSRIPIKERASSARLSRKRRARFIFFAISSTDGPVSRCLGACVSLFNSSDIASRAEPRP
jgi:hypothetical protein